MGDAPDGLLNPTAIQSQITKSGTTFNEISAVTNTAASTALAFDTTIANLTPTTVPATTSASQSKAAAVTQTVISTKSAAPTTVPSSSDNGLSGAKLAMILGPVIGVVILIPIIWLLYIFFRNRRRDRQRLSSPDMRGPPPAESRLLRHSPENSMVLPSPFKDSERIKSGALNVWEVEQSIVEKPRNGTFSPPPRDSLRASSELSHRPSPTLPSPNAPMFRRPPSDAWPLPSSGKLPSPVSPPYDPHMNTNKPLPSPSTLSQSHIPSLASSDALALPVVGARPTSSNYDLTPSSATFPEPLHPGAQTAGSDRLNPFNNNSPQHNSRDSDLVSELSFHQNPEHEETKRDTDAISVISAMTNSGKRRSGRDTDAMSVVSAMSPDEPRIPIEHFPL